MKTGPVTVSAVVVSHGHAAELERSLPALASQVDDLLVIANVAGERRRGPRGRSRCSRTSGGSRSRPTSTWGSRRRRASTSWSRIRTPIRSKERSPSSSGSPTLIRRPGSSARSCSGPTGPGSRASAGSRPCSGRSGGARRCGCCADRTTIRSPTTARGRLRARAGRLAARRRLPADATADARAARRLGRRLPALRRGHRRRLPRRAGRLGAVARPRRGRSARLRSRDRQALPLPAHALARCAGCCGSCASTRSGCSRCAEPTAGSGTKPNATWAPSCADVAARRVDLGGDERRRDRDVDVEGDRRRHDDGLERAGCEPDAGRPCSRGRVAGWFALTTTVPTRTTTFAVGIASPRRHPGATTRSCANPRETPSSGAY